MNVCASLSSLNVPHSRPASNVTWTESVDAPYFVAIAAEDKIDSCKSSPATPPCHKAERRTGYRIFKEDQFSLFSDKSSTTTYTYRPIVCNAGPSATLKTFCTVYASIQGPDPAPTPDAPPYEVVIREYRQDLAPGSCLDTSSFGRPDLYHMELVG